MCSPKIDTTMHKDPKTRCVNIDWLEVYCLESNDRYPCNADYFRSKGFIVHEREYGTRQYNEMFTLEDERGNKWLEIRRNPMSGSSSFSGLSELSCHIRLVNRACYEDDCIEKLREFLLTHDYTFKRIYRIDVCYDFEFFDTWDRPQKFVRRYLKGKFAKINQVKCAAYGEDNWASFDWETVSWGSRTSMVSTKIYCKTKELKAIKGDKPWVKWAWFVNGLVDEPVQLTKVNSRGVKYTPEIWRIEFSLKSTVDGWIVIEDQSGKKVKKKAIPHRLELFDSRDKLWQRFEDLAFHYFRFKKLEQGKSKHKCEDKVLFYFNERREFLKLGALPQESKMERPEELMRRKLQAYKLNHGDVKVREACDVILQYIQENEIRRITPRESVIDARAWQMALAARMAGDKREALELVESIRQMLARDEIF